MTAFEPCSPPSPPPSSIAGRGLSRALRLVPRAQSAAAERVLRALQRAGAGAFGGLLAESGLLEQLGDRFTLLAPSDEALAELEDELEGGGLEGAVARHRMLAFHAIVGEALPARALGQREFLPTCHGQRLGCEVDDAGEVEVEGASLLRPDLEVGGALVHVIDRVLLPAELDLLELLWLSDSHARLLAAFEVLGLEERLRGGSTFTLLVPRGLDSLPTWRWTALLRPSGHDQLRALIHRHVIPGRVYLSGAATQRTRNLAGHALPIEREGDLRVAGRRVLAADIEARNGLVHVIEGMVGARGLVE